MSKKNVLFMAFAKGVESKDVVVKRYVGVGQVKVLGINPTAAQIKEWCGFEPKEEPTYIGVQQNAEGKDVKFARICVVVRTVPEKCGGVEITQMLNFFARNQIVKGNNSGKYQIIDIYGRTAWATKEDIDAKKIPMYTKSDGTQFPANISADYTPLYVGQEDIVKFIRTYLGIGNVQNYINGTWVTKQGDEAKDCIGGLDDIQALFTGNVSEIRDAIALQPNNKVKLLFGVIHNDEGKEFQTIYPSMILRPNATDYSKLQAHIEERKANGALASHTYEFCEFKEYIVQASNLDEAPLGEAPATEATPW